MRTTPSPFMSLSSLSSVALALGVSAIAVACGGAPEPVAPTTAPTGPSAGTEKKPAAGGDDSAAKAAALETLTAGEAKSGNCDAEHKAALEKVLADVETGMKAKNGEDGKPLNLQVVGKRVLALGPNARGVEMTVTGRGTEVHVLAYGVKEISMDVLAGTTAATTLRSPFQRSSTASPMSIDVPKVGPVTDVQSDSRQVSIKPGQPLEVKLTGQGCAALVTFVKP